MKKWTERRKRDCLAVEKIMREVCIKHQVAPTEFLSRHRHARLVRARQEACWRARVETKASFPTIGEVLERHYTSVMHLVQRHLERTRGVEVIRELTPITSLSPNCFDQTAGV